MTFWSLFGLRGPRGRSSLAMRILIVGGFGYVGGRIAVHLAKLGHQIVLGSRKKTTVPPAWLPQAKVVQVEWEDDAALRRICNQSDTVIQAAGMNAQDCSCDPVAALDFNGVATARLVAAATSVGVKRFVYLSTAHVYADPLVGTITEQTCSRNLHPYATSHIAGEHSVLRAGQIRQIQSTVLRLSNAFGIPTHHDANCWSLLVNDLCMQATKTGKLVLKSNGLQQRDFVTLTDVGRAIEHILNLDQHQLADGVFNIGSGASISVMEMTKLIADRCLYNYKFKPEIIKPNSPKNESALALQFNCGKIGNTGFMLTAEMNYEIDRILEMCMNIHECKADE